MYAKIFSIRWKFRLDASIRKDLNLHFEYLRVDDLHLLKIRTDARESNNEKQYGIDDDEVIRCCIERGIPVYMEKVGLISTPLNMTHSGNQDCINVERLKTLLDEWIEESSIMEPSYPDLLLVFLNMIRNENHVVKGA